MIKVDEIEVLNFKGAVRGLRNPLASHHLSDSECKFSDDEFGGSWVYCIGDKDLKLMNKLYEAGSEHAKYLRQIFISMDIDAPLYWWKQADQYQIGVTTNSYSTMHKIHAKQFTLDDFSHEHLDMLGIDTLQGLIKILNTYRDCYNETKDKKYWWNIIQLLPSSYNQKRTITMSYANVVNMIKQREFHKLDEWRAFVQLLKGLPYMKEIRGE